MGDCDSREAADGSSSFSAAIAGGRAVTGETPDAADAS
jgi:hypothetical protein